MLSTLRKGTSKKDTTILLQNLLNEWGCNLVIDGNFYNKTLNCFKKFQLDNHLIVDGIVGAKSWIVFQQKFPDYFQSIQSKFLSENDLIVASDILNVDIATIKAIYKVESNGRGFIDERPKILFEGHVFWRQLKENGIDPMDYLYGNEDILYLHYHRTYYKLDQYKRVKKAEKIDHVSALESASWGLFQIMGYHWNSLGYATIDKFIEKMYESEGEQLIAFIKYIEVNGLNRFLKVKDWAGFARAYNGKSYRDNRYDEKLARAYRAYSII